MRREDRATARRQLDKRLILLSDPATLARPPRGWIKAIREAVGMTTAQLARRLGVSQPRVIAIEKAEAKNSITLDSLERAAQALDCRLVYALVPRKSFDAVIKERADRLARQRLESTRHSMGLEAQNVDPADADEQLKRLTRSLIEHAGSELWEPEHD